MSEYILDTSKCICEAIPAGEIVRCRDCRWGRAVEQVGCLRFEDRANPDGLTDPDGYCAWGEIAETGSPSASIAKLGREVSDAYVRECERNGITSSGMDYRYVSDVDDGKGC